MIQRCTIARAPLVLATGILFSGCATAQMSAQGTLPQDPLERYNRAMFAFNETVDRALIRPVAVAYDTAVPDVVRLMIGNFFSNLGDVWTGTNNLLQGKPRDAVSDAARVLINSTLGFAGVADLATELGLSKSHEDFGQTLGVWGVPAGPYLVLPLLGPSSLRDAAALPVDWTGDLVRHVGDDPTTNWLYATRLVDVRASLFQGERILEAAALDRYSIIRDGYLQRRRSMVYDGRVPADEDDYKPPPKYED